MTKIGRCWLALSLLSISREMIRKEEQDTTGRRVTVVGGRTIQLLEPLEVGPRF